MSVNPLNVFDVVEKPRLSDLPVEQINISCVKCSLEWQDDKRTAIASLGNIRVDQLVWQISGHCKRKGWSPTRVQRH